MSYIVPMKKPICINCPFRNVDNCTLIYLMSDKDSEVTVHVNEMTVSPDCPLVEIPTPHGRLGDLDALKAQYKYSEADSEDERVWIMNIRRAITNAPTVIEAEGEKDGR